MSIAALLTTAGAMAQYNNPKLANKLAAYLNDNAEHIAATAQPAKAKTMTMAKGTAPMQILAVDTTEVKKAADFEFNADGSIKTIGAIVTLKEGCSCPEAALKAMGISFDIISQSIVTMRIPAEYLDRVCSLEEVKLVEVSGVAKECSNMARSSVFAEDVLQGTNLSTPYTGKGIIVGVIDSGIDFNHPAFKDPATGKTRIVEAITFEGGTLKKRTSEEDIAKLTAASTSSCHGTHTSNLAAGSQVDGNGMNGMAPEADLILCDLGDSKYESHMLQAIREIISFADKEGKPVVINLSLGIIPMNFLTTNNNNVATALKEITDNGTKKGQIIVISSGNNAAQSTSVINTLGEPNMLGYNLMTILNGSSVMYDNKYNVVAYSSGIDGFFYADDDKNFTVDYMVVNVKTGELFSLSEKPLYSTGNTKLSQLTTSSSKDTATQRFYRNISKTGSYLFHEPDLALALCIKGNEGQTIRMMNSSYSFVGNETYPTLTVFTEGTRDISINPYVITDGVISVGAYNDRCRFTGFNGTEYKTHSYSTRYPEKSISYFSGYAVDDYNIAHPDVLAPGAFICSAANIYDTNYFNNFELKGTSTVDGSQRNIDYYVTNYTKPADGESLPYAYVQLTGTSQSSPIVAGIVALWLQANPELTVADVKDVIKATSINDEYTTNASLIPSRNTVQAGNGKINAYEGLKYILGEDTYIANAGITETNTTEGSSYIYNVLGQRVNGNATDIIIINGRKYVK